MEENKVICEKKPKSDLSPFKKKKVFKILI